MNINCPHCSAYLTVPEQYAGQLMKCPKCSSNFTVPALPAIDHEPAFAMAPNPPSPAPAAASGTGSHGMEAPIPLAPEVPAFNLAPPEPAFATTPAPAPATPAGPAPTSISTSASAPAPVRSTPGPVRTTPGVATHSIGVPLPLNVLRWVPVGAAVLLFILQIFPWVGVYPGGVPAVTQDAWQIAFGSYTQDADMNDIFSIRPEAEANAATDKRADSAKVLHDKPGASPLMIFYLLLFFLPTLVVSIAVAALPFVQVNLPPAVANLLPWKWAIVAVLNLLMLLFLGLYLVLNFSLEGKVKDWARNQAERELKSAGQAKIENLGTKERNTLDARRGVFEQYLHRTVWWKLAFFVHILSTLAACLVYWMDKHHVPEVRAEAGLRW